MIFFFVFPKREGEREIYIARRRDTIDSNMTDTLDGHEKKAVLNRDVLASRAWLLRVDTVSGGRTLLGPLGSAAPLDLSYSPTMVDAAVPYFRSSTYVCSSALVIRLV